VKITIRTDASLKIGAGHVMRCLTLADALFRQGNEVIFICKEHDSNLINKIIDSGYEVKAISVAPESYLDSSLAHSEWLGGTQEDDSEKTIAAISSIEVDWMIVDHYALDELWHKKIRPHVKHIFVIDDLGDRLHDCDLLLDQNLGATKEKYRDSVSKDCELLLGPEYALLRPEFVEWRERSLERRRYSAEPKNILVSLGGVDAQNITTDVINELSKTSSLADAEVNVVLGVQSPHIKAIKMAAKKSILEIKVHVDSKRMAELMSQADFAIGASGSSSLERCTLGVPSLTFILADNQKTNAKMLDEMQASIVITSQTELASTIRRLSKKLSIFSRNAAKVLDGLGLSRVVNKLVYNKVKVIFNDETELKILNLISLTATQHLEVLKARNHPNVKAAMFSTKEISFVEHKKFLDKISSDFRKKYYAVYESDSLIGVIYFTEINWLYHASFGIYSNLIRRADHVGDKLMTVALSMANKFQFIYLSLEVDMKNYRAINLYEKWGFEKMHEYDSNSRTFIQYKKYLR